MWRLDQKTWAKQITSDFYFEKKSIKTVWNTADALNINTGV